MSLKTPSKRERLTTQEEYFHRLDVELLDQMRGRAALEEERLQLGEVSHVNDQAILDALAQAGFDHGNATMLPLVPLIQVAWIDGSVSRAERDSIARMALSLGIKEGSSAGQQLSMWLDRRPSEEVFRTAIRALRAQLEALPPSQSEASVGSLLQNCADIAAASGGLFGLTSPVSGDEQELLEDLARQLVPDTRTPRP